MRARIRRVAMGSLLAAMLGTSVGASDITREQALAAKQKSEAAIKAAQDALVAARNANRPDVVQRAQRLIEENVRKRDEADALLHAPALAPTSAADNPLRDLMFVSAALKDAKKEVETAESVWGEALMAGLYEPDPTIGNAAKDTAWVQFQRAQQAYRDLRAKKQELEHPQLMADMQRLRQDPALAAELDHVLQRVRQEELERLKVLDDVDHAETAVRLELKRLKDSGAFSDSADLLAKAKTDPRVRAALDRAREAVMHDQGDILRDSTDEIAGEVQRLKQKLSAPASR